MENRRQENQVQFAFDLVNKLNAISINTNIYSFRHTLIGKS